MKKTVKVNINEPVIHLSTEVVYGHRVAWAGVDYRQLKMSIIKPRVHFDYDSREKRPLLLFLAGGGFSEMERNAWIPDLVWFARKGYVVASPDYSVTARTKFPMQIEDVKLAIRYMRAHADEFGFDGNKIIIAGESAGGYLAGLAALSNGDNKYDVGEYADMSSDVSGAILLYPGVDMTKFLPESPALQDLARAEAVPMMILQGTADVLVHPDKHSDLLYDALEKAGAPVDYYLIEGADHAAAEFYQDEMKEVMLEFMNRI